MAQLEDMKQFLRDAFARDPKIRSPRIDVTFFEDTLALTGEVGSLQAREEAERIARQVAPGMPIDNSLVIVNNRIDDDQTLTEKARDALFQAGIDLGVRVTHGLAHLQGNPETLELRNEAHRIVSAISGIRGVRDEEATVMGRQTTQPEPPYRQEGKFQIPPESPQVIVGRDDITITNDIEQLLATAMQPAPRADEIDVSVSNGTVTLNGWVKSAEERARAEILAKEVSGVKSVKNQLVSIDGSSVGDEALQRQVRQAINRPTIQIAAVDGTLYLWGEVDKPEQREQAEQQVRTIAGVQKVVNDLRIVSRHSRPVSGPNGGQEMGHRGTSRPK